MKLLMENWRKYLTEQEAAANKKIYVLVGPPSVGKSTWIKNTFQQEHPYTINRDDIVEKIASAHGWTYDDMFMLPPAGSNEGDVSQKYGTVVKSPAYMTWAPLSYDKVLDANNQVAAEFNARVTGAKGQQNIVVDMTNMNAAARKGALKAIEGAEHEYHKVAVVFNFQGAEEIIKKVAAKRAAEAQAAGKSKTIPDAAFDRMFKSFQQVDKEGEGFDEVVSVDNIAALKKQVPQQSQQKAQQPVQESLKKIRKIIKKI